MFFIKNVEAEKSFWRHQSCVSHVTTEIYTENLQHFTRQSQSIEPVAKPFSHTWHRAL
ncbi:hypothetical protein HDU92_000865, partial [Lobulomyces angularis]